MNPSQRWHPERVFVYRHPVDMRKQILGLSNIVSMQLGRDPGDESMYVFVNKGRDKIKLLIWHRNGFWLLYKRLEKQRFHWPDWFESDVLSFTQEQLDHLLDGFNLNGMRAHRVLSFNHSV